MSLSPARRLVAIASLVLLLAIAVWLVLQRPGSPAERGAASATPVAGSETPPAAAAIEIPVAAVALPEAVAAFRTWSGQWSAADSAEKTAMVAEGLALAEAHRSEIARLIRENPEFAIQCAVPMVIRQDLPPEIVARLEERVRAQGALEVYANVPDPDADPATQAPPVSRFFTAADGRAWNAFVYGKRADRRTRLTASTHGVAVERDLAVLDSPLRILEIGERPDPGDRPVVESCPISGIETPVERSESGELPPVTEETPVYETATAVVYVCSGGHISAVEQQLDYEEDLAHWQSLGIDLTTLNSGGGSGPAHGPLSVPGSWSTGHRNLLFIRATFPDTLADPQSDAECHDAMRQLADYITENSYGRCYFTWTVAPLVVLPYPESWYVQRQTDGLAADTLIQAHARTVALSKGYDTAQYAFDVVRWSGSVGNYGGSASVGAKGIRMKTNAVGTLIHELGHNLGVWHSNAWRSTPPSVTGPGENSEYGNKFDVMGVSSSMGHFTAHFKNVLNWLPNEDHWSVRESGLYRIHQYDEGRAQPDLRYALRITKDAERDYWYEFRQRFTSNPALMNGLMVTWDGWGLGGIGGSGGNPPNGSNRGAQLLDMTPGSFGHGIIDTRDDAALYVGRTFTDEEDGIHVTPVFKDTTSSPPAMDVVVNLGNFAGNQAPELQVAAGTTATTANTPVTLTATASDPDGDTLAYAWSFGDGTYSTNNSPVQSKAWSATGHYQVLCTASDMKGRRTTRAVLVTVGSPSSSTISGQVTGPGGAPLEGVYVATHLNATLPDYPFSHPSSSTFRGTWTDSEGNYTLTGVGSGSYTITPTLYPYQFTASGFSNPVSVSPSRTGINFTAQPVPVLTITVTDAMAAEGASPANGGTIRISRTGSTLADLEVQVFNSSSGTAVRNTDYSLSPAPVAAQLDGTGSGALKFTIPAGQSFLDVQLSVTNDSTAEGLETAILDFANTTSSYFLSGGSRAVVEIADDDTPLPVVRLQPLDLLAGEAGPRPARLSVERFGSTTGSLTVNLAYSGTAVAGTDFTAPTSVTIPAGAREALFEIVPIDDASDEGTETLMATIATNAAYVRTNTGVFQQTVSIADDDLPRLSITATEPTAPESGTSAGVFTIVRTGGDLSLPLTVDYSVAGTAVHGTDFRRLDGQAVIPAGQTQTTVEIWPYDDDLDEASQTVIMRLRSSPRYEIGAAVGTVTITDDESSQFYVRVATSSGQEPVSGSSTVISYQIVRPAAGGAVTVNYAITGTAIPGTDFTTLPGSISFTASETSKTINVFALSDALAENAETVTLTLQASANYGFVSGLPQSGTGWIIDRLQETVNVSVADTATTLTTAGNEASTSLRFILSRRVATSSPLTVSYTMSGTATQGVDYSALSGSATIAANETSVYVPITVIDDSIAEGVESIIMTVTPASGSYGVRIGSATMLVGDNDSYASGSVGFGSSSSTLAETAGTASIPVNLTGSPAGAVTVHYRINGGTATAGHDYTFENGFLQFAPGETSKSLALTALHDHLPEPSETVILQLYNVTGANLGSSSHTLNLLNRSRPEGWTDPASSVLLTSAALNGRVNPHGLATTVWFEYGGTTAYGQTTSPQSIGSGSSIVYVIAPVSGLNLPGYHFRLVAQNSGGLSYGINQSFGADASPSVETLPASLVSVSGATLNGIANVNGAAGSAWFEYGPSPALGSSSAPQAISAGTTDVPVSFALTGLPPNSTWYFRLRVETGVGAVQGQVLSFTTTSPVILSTGSRIGVGHTGISIDGRANPGGDASLAYFEYGTGGNLNLQSAPQDIGNGVAEVVVHGAIQGLQPNTEYQVRLAVSNNSGVSRGAIQKIRTLPQPEVSEVVEPLFVFTNTGTAPQAGLVRGSDGFLYGTTSTGGSYGSGTIFRLGETGEFSTVDSFYNNTGGVISGANPQTPLLAASDGHLYGTTYSGGTNGSGTIYRITPGGEVEILVSFTSTGSAPGTTPSSPLAEGTGGALYGVTHSGGSGSLGTIFRYVPGSGFSSLVSFTGTSGSFLGSNPRGGLVRGTDGHFYGTASNGGSSSLGSFFRITEAGAFTTLAPFTNTNGSVPIGTLAVGTDGNFYGTTSSGGTNTAGTFFRATPAGVITALFHFTGQSGAYPGSASEGGLFLAPDGWFYGTTTTGGAGSNLGTIFRANSSGQYELLGSFTGNTGALPGSGPNGDLVAGSDGKLYGTTAAGGAHGVGVVFRVVPGGAVTAIHHFTPSPNPLPPADGPDGMIRTLTLTGGATLNSGLALQGPPGGAIGITGELPPVSGTTAVNPRGGIQRGSDGDYFAPLGAGGTGSGSVLRLTPSGGRTNLITFTGVSGNFLGTNPSSRLVKGDGDQLYGLTQAGGSSGFGTIYRITEAGSFSSELSFTGNGGQRPGSGPQGALLRVGATFYGTTSTGGSANQGTLFRWTPGGAHEVLVHFSGSVGDYPGSSPLGEIVVDDGGSIYGVCRNGGSGNNGLVYRYRSDGTYEVLASFTNTSGTTPGGLPTSGLFVGPDGLFYGTTSAGGVHGKGVLFRVTDDGSVRTIWEFSGREDGVVPSNGISVGTDGSVYGASHHGLLRITPPPAALTYPATSITSAGATLHGGGTSSVGPFLARFEFGTHPSQLDQSSLPVSFPGGTLSHRWSTVLTGLQPYTLYHYRATVEAESGIYQGAVRTFRTGNEAHFAGPADIPVRVESFSAKGLPLAVSLGFDPLPGTVLTLVEQTGFMPVGGWFTGIPEGGHFAADFNGQTRWFVVSYLGGDGNDITLTAADQVITFPLVGRKLPTDPPFTLDATASSGLPVSYEILTGTALATLNGNTVNLLGGQGAVSIRATQSGGGLMGAAPPVVRTFVITNAPAFTQVQASRAVDSFAALATDGSLNVWGVNSGGNYGNGTSLTGSIPTAGGGGMLWDRIAFGANHVLAIRNGELWAWGTNANGQVGNGSTSNQLSPVRIGTASDWAAVAAGNAFSLAIKADGTLWSWGSATDGRLGNGSTTGDVLVPTQVGTATSWSALPQRLSAGETFALAVRTDGTLWAWGFNVGGQLGDGTTTTRSTPVQVGSSNAWRAVSGGSAFSLGILSDGSLWSWGSNVNGQLGDGNLTNRSTPSRIAPERSWQTMSAGPNFGYAIATDGSLWSWGWNPVGQAGRGIADPVSGGGVPQRVGLESDWISVAAGANSAAGVRADGTLWTWGGSSNRQLGRNQRLPAPAFPTAFGPVLEVAAGNSHGLAIRPDGSLWAWGLNSNGRLGIGENDFGQRREPVRVGSETDWSLVAAGLSHSLAIRADGTLWTWGANTSGQLGVGDSTHRYAPVAPVPGTSWLRASGGSSHSAAIRADGTLWTWGLNDQGQLGLGNTTQRFSPVQVGSDTTWIDVACGANHTFALKSDGSLWAWGRNNEGQLGQGDTTNRSLPTRVGNATDWTRIAAGANHGLGLRGIGTLWGWGQNNNYQLGDGTNSNRSTPFQIGSLSTWRSIVAGLSHSLATRADGSLWFLGSNIHGQRGNGGSSTITTPTQFLASSHWDRVAPASSGQFTLAINRAGHLFAVGLNHNAQTGVAGMDQYVPGLVLPGLPAAPQALTFNPPASGVIGEEIVLNAITGSGLPARFAATGPARLDGNRLRLTGLGEVRVTAWQPGDDHIQGSDMLVASIQVNKVPQTIDFPAIGSQLTTDTLLLSASGGASGNPIIFTLAEGPALLRNGNEITFTGAGTVRIIANQAGGPEHEPAAPVERSITVTKASASVSLTSLAHTYDGLPKSAVGTTDPGGLDLVVTYQNLPGAPTAAGSYPVLATIDDPIYQGSASGTLVIAKAAQAITFPAISDQTATATVPLSATGGGSGEPVTYTATAPGLVVGNVLSFNGAGSVTVTARQAGDSNHEAAPPVERTLMVTKASAALQLSALEHTYDGLPHGAHAATTPAGLAVALQYNGGTDLPLGAGSYAVTAEILAPVYAGTATASLTIAKAAQAISFAPIPDQVATATVLLSATGGGSGQDIVFSVKTGPAEVNGNRLTFTGTGSVTVAANQSGGPNHLPASEATNTLQVTAATATLVLTRLHQVADGTPRTVTATTDPAGLGVDILYDGEAEPPLAPGSYPVSATIDDPRHEGAASATLIVDDPSILVPVAGGTLPALSVLGPISTDSFYLGRYELTWGLWREVRDWAAANGYPELADTGQGGGDDHPVQNITWHEALLWCNARTERENALYGEGLAPVYRVGGAVYRSGRPDPATITPDPGVSGYRLPDALEWEYAARGGLASNGTPYPGGSEPDSLAWHSTNSIGAEPPLADGRGTWPAGGKTPNELGLHELAGNVAEWTSTPDSTDSARYLVRGGHWDSIPSALALSAHDSALPTAPDSRRGLRLARSLATALAAATESASTDWSVGGDGHWFAQTATSYDASDAASSGPTAPGESRWIETRVTGPGFLRFRWKTSGLAPGARLVAQMGDVESLVLTADTDWAEASLTLVEGSSTVRWLLSNPEVSGAGGEGAQPARAWLDQVTLIPPGTIPSLETLPATDLTESSATVSCEINDDGGQPILARGFVLAASPDPTLGIGTDHPDDSGDPSAPGTYSLDLAGLSPGTTWHVRAYATNVHGTAYGSNRTFTTDEVLEIIDGLAERNRRILSGDRHQLHFRLDSPRRLVLGGSGLAGLRLELRASDGSLITGFMAGNTTPVLSMGLLAGDYTLVVIHETAAVAGAAAGDPSPGQEYTLSLDTRLAAFRRPDIAVGASLGALRGVASYTAPSGQQVLLTSRSLRKVTGYASVANRGDIADRLRVYGSRGDSRFSILYQTSSGANVTAALHGGRHLTGLIKGGDAATAIRANITPNSKRLRKKKGKRSVIVRTTFTATLRATADSEPGLKDEGWIRVQTR